MTHESADATERTAYAAPAAAPRLSRAFRALRDGVAAGGDRPAGGADRADPTGPLDMHDLSRRLRGRGDLISKTLALFRDECERGIAELRGRIDEGNLSEAAAAAHRIKGAAATASAYAVRDAAGAVEEGCRQGRAAEVIAGFSRLERAASLATTRIAGELTRNDASPPGGDVEKP